MHELEDVVLCYAVVLCCVCFIFSSILLGYTQHSIRISEWKVKEESVKTNGNKRKKVHKTRGNVFIIYMRWMHNYSAAVAVVVVVADIIPLGCNNTQIHVISWYSWLQIIWRRKITHTPFYTNSHTHIERKKSLGKITASPDGIMNKKKKMWIIIIEIKLNKRCCRNDR